MNKPSKNKIIEHYKNGVGEKCLVCESELRGNWTDYNGQIKCWKCGTTYQILGSHLKEEFLKENNLSKEDIAKKYCDCFEDIPLLKAYWKETGNKLPLGFYMGSGPISKEERNDFYKWVFQHREELKDWEDDYYWERMANL